MKKTLIFLVISVAVLFFFSGCFKPPSTEGISISGPDSTNLNTSVQFKAEITGTTAGGLGGFFSKPPTIASAEWTFSNLSNSAQTFKKTVSTDTCQVSFTYPGEYIASVKITTNKEDTIVSKTTENKSFDVLKATPRITTGVFTEQEQPITDNSSVRKNQHVLFEVLSLEDDDVPGTSIGQYYVRWEMYEVTPDSANRGRTLVGSQDYQKLDEGTDFSFVFPDKGLYELQVMVKDIFNLVYTFPSVQTFDVQTAIPTVPTLIEHGWSNDLSSYRLLFSYSADAYYYSVYREAQVGSGVYEFIGNAFLNGTANVEFYDRHPMKGAVSYKVVAVDGAGSSSEGLFPINVANRPPTKVRVSYPVGALYNVDLANFVAYWTGGEDPDLGDEVGYKVYIKESSSFALVGTSYNKSVLLNYPFMSGKTYYIRVDSFDEYTQTIGDVYSFSIEPIGSPTVNSASYRYNPSKYKWETTVNFTFPNPYLNVSTISTKYVLQFSKYASFPGAYTYEHEVYYQGNVYLEVPEYYSKPGEPLFVRVKAVCTNIYQMQISSLWSNVYKIK
ncbi:MAG TPA: hypothetical protein PLF96_03965 [Thermotogota bacterium]|nr:hypothetical protein [Thermotogota bacterium]